jgi:D-3-phosphoglycerate dehydrogenase / 2-oxoglutarate reductase
LDKPQVVVLDGGYDSYDIEKSILAPFVAELISRPCEGSEERVKVVSAEADAVLVRKSR